MDAEARDRAHQVGARRVHRHALGREAREALHPLLQQEQRAHAIAEPQRALDHELALGDEDAVASAAGAFRAQAQRGRAQVRVLAHARVERVVEEHRACTVVRTVWGMNEFDRVGALALRHLVAFETVAEERSFTRAARRLGYTQSAVSHQMATLERLVGKQLIERPRGSEAANLTEAGEILHGHARALIRRVKLAYDDLDGLAEGISGTFRFGTYQSASTSILPHVLRQFAQLFPLVRVHLTESVDDLALVRELEEGTLDASFVSLPMPEGPLAAVELLRDPFVLLVAPDSPFAGRTTAPSLAEIAQLPLIAWKSWRGVEDAVRERGYELNVIMRSDDSDTVRSLVGAGVGAAIVPRLIVDPFGSLIAIPLDDAFGERVLALAWHPERRRTPVLTAFTELVQAVCSGDLLDVSPRPGLRRG